METGPPHKAFLSVCVCMCVCVTVFLCQWGLLTGPKATGATGATSCVALAKAVTQTDTTLASQDDTPTAPVFTSHELAHMRQQVTLSTIQYMGLLDLRTVRQGMYVVDSVVYTGHTKKGDVILIPSSLTPCHAPVSI